MTQRYPNLISASYHLLTALVLMALVGAPHIRSWASPSDSSDEYSYGWELSETEIKKFSEDWTYPSSLPLVEINVQFLPPKADEDGFLAHQYQIRSSAPRGPPTC